MDRRTWWATVHGIPKSQTGAHMHINRKEKANYVIISINAGKKRSDKNQHPFIVFKKLQQTGKIKKFPQTDKGNFKTFTINCIYGGKK